MRRTDDYCVGCPQGCIHCGRKHVTHYVCDGENCDADTIDGVTKLYEDEGKQYCLMCIIKNNLNEFIGDMITDHGYKWVTDNFCEVTE